MISAEKSSRPKGRGGLRFKRSSVYELNAVDTLPVHKGGNFGWVFREGTRDNTTDSGRTLPSGFTSIAPIAEYTHAAAGVGAWVCGEAAPGSCGFHGRLLFRETPTEC